MNRRTFLRVAGGALAAAACAARAATHPRSPGAMQMPMQTPARVAVYDPTLSRGRALARAAARRGMPAFALADAVGEDIGMLWHTRLARRFEACRTDARRTDAPLDAQCAICALRASDRFVLERLATPRRWIVLNVPQG